MCRGLADGHVAWQPVSDAFMLVQKRQLSKVSGRAAFHRITCLNLTRLCVLLVYRVFISFCCYRLLAVWSVVCCAGPSGISWTIARSCHIAVQQSQAVLCVQSREMDWESAACTSALVKYAPYQLGTCTVLLM